jgi:hypothetical protein
VNNNDKKIKEKEMSTLDNVDYFPPNDYANFAMQSRGKELGYPPLSLLTFFRELK